MAHPAVLNAVRAAFNLSPDQVVDRLHDVDDRVLGLVIVENSPEFNEMNQRERNRRMWDELHRNAGEVVVNVGVVMLKNPAEAAAVGFS